jgi:glucokinase
VNVTNSTLFVADIGGTKSDLAVFSANDLRTPTYTQRFINTQYSGVEEIVTQFMATTGVTPAVACFAIAGIVSDNKAQMTNLPWEVRGDQITARFGFKKVLIINDLTAVASSLRYLDIDNPSAVLSILRGIPEAGAVSGVIAPGTGLGEGFVVDVGGKTFVTGSEGGHTGFAPVDDEQVALLSWIENLLKPISYETLIAGPGIARLYDFCRVYHKMDESQDVIDDMAGKADRTPAIIRGVTRGNQCPLCQKVIELFLRILGSEAANLALKLYAKGGIYLGGGILPRLVGHVSFDGFKESFLNKGPMSELMAEIPVMLLLNKDAALIGAAGYLVEFINENEQEL